MNIFTYDSLYFVFNSQLITMNQQLIEIQDAENNLLACATFLAENIKSADGHAEAMKEIIPRYLAKNEVDLAAEFADSIEDPFVRDQLLTIVAEKCAEIDDDEYALQLAEAIEDSSFQGVCLEGIAKQKAIKLQFEKAFEIADDLEHGSNAYIEIAIRQEKAEALQTVEKIELPLTKVYALQEIVNNTKDAELLEKATQIAQNIEYSEEKIRAFLGISFQYIELNRKDKAIEVLDKARQYAETLYNSHQDSFLSQISQGFMKAGSLDLADRTLDLVKDKYEIANALVGYADEFKEKNEDAEALEALEEAYAILKSQRDSETRNSKAKFNLMGIIALRFVNFDKLEKAIEIANENPYDEIRYSTLAQIAQLCALKDKDELAQQAVELIDDESEKAFALIGLSDAKRNNKQNDDALKLLNEAFFQVGTIQQLSMRSLALNQFAKRFQILGQEEKARNLCTESLDVIQKILDQTHQVSALTSLADTFEDLKFELNEAEKSILQNLIRKTAL